MPGARTVRPDPAEVRRLVTELLDEAARQNRSLRGLARDAGLGVSATQAWRSGRSAPRLGSALRTGHALGLRLDWEPMDRRPSATVEAPPEARWRTSHRSPVELVVDPTEEPVTYNAQLLGAELHWYRTQVRELPLWQAKGVSHGTWWGLERGLEGDRSAKDQLLHSYISAGARVGLRLVWLPLDAPWRRRPWQGDGPGYKTP